MFFAHLSRTSTRFRGRPCKCVTRELSLIRPCRCPNLRFRRLGHFRRIMTLCFRRRGGSALAYFGLAVVRDCSAKALDLRLEFPRHGGVPSVLGGEPVLTGTCRTRTLRFRRRGGFSHAVLRLPERCVVEASALSLGASRILEPLDPPLSVFGFEISLFAVEGFVRHIGEVLVFEARGRSRGPSYRLIPGFMTLRFSVLFRSFVRFNSLGFGRGDLIFCRGRSSCVGDDLALPLEASPGGALCAEIRFNLFRPRFCLSEPGVNSGFTLGIVDAFEHRHLVCKVSSQSNCIDSQLGAFKWVFFSLFLFNFPPFLCMLMSGWFYGILMMRYSSAALFRLNIQPLACI